jgi:hypothetical protein
MYRINHTYTDFNNNKKKTNTEYYFVEKRELTKKDALAAVTVPCGLMKAGFNLAIASKEDGRIPLSFATGSSTPRKYTYVCI